MNEQADGVPHANELSLRQALFRAGQQAKGGDLLVLGSASGKANLEALVEGMHQNLRQPRLFLLEANPTRFQALAEQLADLPQVVCLPMVSVEVDQMVSDGEVQSWAGGHPEPVDVPSLLHQLNQEKQVLQDHAIPCSGIRFIKEKYGVQQFALVLIDGSEFRGSFELDEVYGANQVVLVDAIGLRNRANVQRLMNDPSYRLIEGETNPVHGYAFFERAVTDLRVEFFTIVLNGMPFLPQQLEVFQQLKLPWRWHVIEGVANHLHDTAWALRNGAEIDDDFHREGLSIDGSTAWLDSVAEAHPDQVLVYRKPPGEFWAGKLEMVRAPLTKLTEECVLWQVDADELWTPPQIERVHRLFQDDARRSSAFYFCDFYVGPNLVSVTPHSYANNLQQDWLRTWRFRPGMEWVAHEPPTLIERLPGGQTIDLGQNFPFTHYETAREGLIFRHLAYVFEHQIAFKEKYYGYKGALEAWHRLQQHDSFPVPLGEFFPWAKGRTMVDRVEQATLSGFFLEQRRQAIVAREQVQEGGDQRKIVIDGVFYQFNPESGIARVWTCLLKRWAKTAFGRRLVVIDRDYSAPRVDGISYLPLQNHQYGNLAQDQRRLEAVCLFFEASLFISTYYSRPLGTPSLMMAYDFIPELFLRDSLGSDPMWMEKILAVERASAYLCISENTQQDLLTFYPQAQAKPVRFVHLASDYTAKSSAEQAEFRWKYKIQRPFWLLVGARRSYKNADLFFNALRQLSSRWGYDVVCTGARDLEIFEGTDLNLRKLRLNDHELQCAYSAAEALVYPSLYEGFGLPILEAMCCGCPVITCKISSIPEVAGEAALYVNPKDTEEMVEALSQVQRLPIREKLIAAGYQQAAKFTWEKAAQECEEFISVVAASLKWDKPSTPSLPALLQDPTILRGLVTLDQQLHRGPNNDRVARKLIETLEATTELPRLAYFKRLLSHRQTMTP